MIECRVIEDVTEHLRFLDTEIAYYGAAPPHIAISIAATDRICAGLLGVMEAHRVIPLADSTEPAIIFSRLKDGEYTNAHLLSELKNLRFHCDQALRKQTFVFIPSERARYFGANAFFGEAVDEALPEARFDIRCSGDCLAVELDTAAVFHLMRVAEHGLRRLARRLRVKLRDNRRPCPIDYGTWDKVIRACNDKIALVRTALPIGPKKQKKLELYGNAADHCLYMKDLWRNNISHTRRPYTLIEAVDAMDRVRSFVQFLVRIL